MSETSTQTSASRNRSPGPGRPRNFDEAAALDAAMKVFWQKGFEATSLDDLTKAMGLSRSSFYSAFDCKQSLFIRAVEHYSRNGLRKLRDVAESADGDAIEAMMMALSNPEGGQDGCMLVNCVTELAPHDEQVAAIGRRHLESIEDIFAHVLSPDHPDEARDMASAYSSLAIGTLALRKAGIPPERIESTLKQARSVLST